MLHLFREDQAVVLQSARDGRVTYPFLLDCREGRSGISSPISHETNSCGPKRPATSPEHLVPTDSVEVECKSQQQIDSLAYRLEYLLLPNGAPLFALKSRFLGVECEYLLLE
jgi:hypothetical protein